MGKRSTLDSATIGKKDEKVIEEVDKLKEELDRSKIEYQRLASSAVSN